MDATSMSQRSESGRSKPQKNRRTWTTLEEQCLVNALKDICRAGMKCDNGFRSGYLQALEKALAHQFPGTDLRGDPHIVSKIHVWKKNYSCLNTMLSRSGFGWNDSTNSIDVCDDQVWKEYVKFDPHARNMRHKSWPYFKDWEVIFGKDRATGDTSGAWQDLLLSEARASVPRSATLPLETDETESVNIGVKPGETSSSLRTCKRKRGSALEVQNTKMADMMSSFFTEMNSQIGALVSKVGVEKDVKGQRQNLIKELGNLPFLLSLEDKITVAKKICSNVNDVDIFYGLSDDQRATMVHMVMKGEY